MERTHQEGYEAIRQERVDYLKAEHFNHPNHVEIETDRQRGVRELRTEKVRYLGQMLNLEEHIAKLQGVLDAIPNQIAGVDQQLLDLGEKP